MPRSGGRNECSIETAFGWIDGFVLDRILNHLRVKRFDKLGGSVAKIVKGRPSRRDAATNQPTTVIVLGNGGPLRRRPNPLQDEYNDDGQQAIGAIRFRPSTSVGVIERSLIRLSNELFDSLNMRIAR